VEPEGSLPHSQEPATCPYQTLLKHSFKYGCISSLLMTAVQFNNFWSLFLLCNFSFSAFHKIFYVISKKQLVHGPDIPQKDEPRLPTRCNGSALAYKVQCRSGKLRL
jgi:hypothetical protein